MRDPSNALFLYLAVVISSLLLGSHWRKVAAVIMAKPAPQPQGQTP